MPDSRRRSLTIYQAKAGLHGSDMLLKEPDRYQYYRVENKYGYLGVLALRPTRHRKPRWFSLFEGKLDEEPEEEDITSASVSAVLLLEGNERSFGLPFGYGRFMLADDAFEDRFGLKATLNAIDSERIRSLDRKTFESIQRKTREQVSQDSSFNDFGLEVEQDLLRAVTGVPLNPRYGYRLTGRDALTITANIDLDNLPELVRDYEQLAERTDYAQRFPWVDHIQEVPKDLAQELDRRLAAAINRVKLDRIWLAAPDIVDWEEISHFTYRDAEAADEYAELSWFDYFAEVRRADDFELKHLRADRVICHRSTGGDPASWQLRQCVCAEIEEADTRYILSEGSWYAIRADFLAKVVESVEEIGITDLELPPFDDKDERSYNQRAATESGGRLALMDRQNIPAPVARGSVEFCDLYDVGRRMIHVKRYGGSSALSHLFAQGVVSARQLQSDRSFRRSNNEKLPTTHRLTDPEAPVNAAEYEVAYAIIAKNRTREELPFFSMVNLKGVHDLLSQLGFGVTLGFVDNHGKAA